MGGVAAAVIGALGLGAGTFIFKRSLAELRLARLIQNTPTARIRSLSMGLAEIDGEVVPRSQLEAPFSGRPCAYWEVDVATRSKGDRWSVVHRATSGHPFFVKDETGLALVYPQGARVEAGTPVEEQCLGVNLPECYSRYLDGLGAGAALWRFGSLRFRERALQEGDHLYVLGTATPRAQSVTVAEGEEFAEAATGTDGWRSRRLRALDHDATAVIRRGEHERAFIISQRSERSLSTALGLQSALGLLAGPALALFGLAGALGAVQAFTAHR